MFCNGIIHGFVLVRDLAMKTPFKFINLFIRVTYTPAAMSVYCSKVRMKKVAVINFLIIPK